MSKANEVNSTELLALAAEALLMCGCQFLFCPGYKAEPEDMKTCFVCDALHKIFEVHPELNSEANDL